MISDRDIIQDETTYGDNRRRLSVRALLRNIILIGQLSRTTTRNELLAAYDLSREGEASLYRLTPRGFLTERELKASDVEALSLAERVAFLKGASLLLGDRLRRGGDCICNMQAIVILPVAAYASILREDVVLARKLWKTFANIPRLCAEKLQLRRHDDEEGQVDLRRRSFDDFIRELTAKTHVGFDADESRLGVLAADQVEQAYRLSGHRLRNGLQIYNKNTILTP
jgi:hypothetical protein